MAKPDRRNRLLASRTSDGPALMTRFRTTARAFLLLALFGLLAGTAAAKSPDPVGRVPAKPAKPRIQGKQIVFPVLGRTQLTNSFGDPRGQGAHEGEDIMAPRKAPALAAEAGRVRFTPGSGRAGCMLYLYGDSGTKYLYVHLNNDLTMSNDNRGNCVQGVAFPRGLKDGQRVARGSTGRIRRRLGRRGRDQPPPPLRDAPGRRCRNRPVSAPQGGEAAPLLRRSGNLLHAHPDRQGRGHEQPAAEGERRDAARLPDGHHAPQPRTRADDHSAGWRPDRALAAGRRSGPGGPRQREARRDRLALDRSLRSPPPTRRPARPARSSPSASCCPAA